MNPKESHEGTGWRLVSKVDVLVDDIELNCWRKRERERTTPIVAFDCGFSIQENARHVPNSDLSRQQVWSNGSDVL